MHIIHGLPDLVRHLSAHTQDQLPDTHWIDLPSASLPAFAPLRTQPNSDAWLADAATQLARITSTLAPAEPASSQAGTRMLVRAADAPPRMGHGPWLPVAVLRQMASPAGQDLHSADCTAPIGKGCCAPSSCSDRFARQVVNRIPGLQGFAACGVGGLGQVAVEDVVHEVQSPSLVEQRACLQRHRIALRNSFLGSLGNVEPQLTVPPDPTINYLGTAGLDDAFLSSVFAFFYIFNINLIRIYIIIFITKFPHELT